MNRHRVPMSKAISKPTKFAKLVEQVGELRKELLGLRAEMRAMVDEAVQKNIGDKIAMIDGALTESILQKEVLIDKGVMTRDEINEKYRDLQAKGKAEA